ncbi:MULTISPECIES: NAD(P)-dependent oxidoreductase [Cyanophyceae]|uniref:NAD(P)H-dependent oxidoreductase n=1 Tax=Cyanophyceae TaxID=3028117 RepID=UPI001687CA07|nr:MULTISPECIES: NAD(P)-dependent oxidoreductase [Cyanophyceae]MBD1917822.1 NAD(P)-dependent oxidoreductase [Phormidium sp. FACHB-77]MBD2032940.1 NAD(P)-dependent oxidoreductase [Phormidium sp. FACHB-322]MBD2051688.1 NAD(P)-dependent oxidoreductase [Leptolyngbya sp. FACHB-60]
MIIVDTALKARHEAGNPVRVGLLGAGFMGRGVINQIVNYTPGMVLTAIANRTVDTAVEAYAKFGVENVKVVSTLGDMEDAIARGYSVVTDDPTLLCQSDSIDVLIEATGHVEYGARVTLAAIEHKKPMVLMNAELDGTVGPILKVYADRAGVIITGCDGDQPGVQLNLYRFVKSIGLNPLLCGNIKGLQDRYRNPTTQESFAKQWGQTAHMVTSFADGTKISFEQAIVANATGMKVAQRGMLGYHSKGHVDDMLDLYDVEQMKSLGGIVDYVVGPKPSPGVFVYATCNEPTQAHYLNYGKLGEGPLYSFYVPYHLTVFEVPLSAARVALLNDVIIAPLGAPVVDVITTAKIDLEVGQTLDGLGGYHTYGQCENADIVNQDNLLPMGLAEGCRLKRPVAKDHVLTYDDVEIPADSVAHRLRAEQNAYFAKAKVAAAV